MGRYLDRIGYFGSTSPSRATLDSLVEHHVRAIPFENVDQFCGTVVDVTLQGIAAKILDGGRGGYCLEQNVLLRAVLDELGFSTSGAAARVSWSKPLEAPPSGLGHLVTLVDLPSPRGGSSGRFVADVGFGVVSITRAVPLDDPAPVRTSFATFRSERTARGTMLWVNAGLRWRPMYSIEVAPVEVADVEVTNWFLCTHPDSVFRRELMVAAVTGEFRATLRNQVLTRYRAGTEPDREVLAVADVPDVLSELGVTVPDAAVLRQHLTEVLG